MIPKQSLLSRQEDMRKKSALRLEKERSERAPALAAAKEHYKEQDRLIRLVHKGKCPKWLAMSIDCLRPDWYIPVSQRSAKASKEA